MAKVEPFSVTDCALIVISTGESAHNLREMHDRLIRTDDPGIMYFHFWDGLLRPDFIDPEYPNDFASWCFRRLHDRRLAERLSLLNPGTFETMNDLRYKLIEVIEDRMDEDDFDPRIDADHPFFFMRSQIVVFHTQTRIEKPEQLPAVVPKLTPGSIFYHFIDARRRTVSGRNDFSEWLKGYSGKYNGLADRISMIDPFFKSLMEIREQLIDVFETYNWDEKSS
jgi:hypothetical protein